jgi:hypothetical protein
MRVTLRNLFIGGLVIVIALVAIRVAIREMGMILSVSAMFFLIAISIVFVAVFSKAYKNWKV